MPQIEIAASVPDTEFIKAIRDSLLAIQAEDVGSKVAKSAMLWTSFNRHIQPAYFVITYYATIYCICALQMKSLAWIMIFSFMILGGGKFDHEVNTDPSECCSEHKDCLPSSQYCDNRNDAVSNTRTSALSA